MKIKGFIFLVLLVLLLASCVPAMPEGKEYNNMYYPDHCTNVAGSVCRVVDHEAGVVCYVYFQVAISCLPIKDTLLDAK